MCVHWEADIQDSPDRWDNLPELASEQPGLFSNILTFSAGPRVSQSCPSRFYCLNWFPVVHWDALFDDRNQIVPVYSLNKFRVYGDRV